MNSYDSRTKTFIVKDRLFYEGGWHIIFKVKHDKNKITFVSRDDSKYYHEKGYEKTYTRTIDKNGCIRFQGSKFNVTNVEVADLDK